MGFLLSRRWIGFACVVAVLAYLALQLGEWQFGRLEDRTRTVELPVRDISTFSAF